jgi:GH43 family beta-xylosidase
MASTKKWSMTTRLPPICGSAARTKLDPVFASSEGNGVYGPARASFTTSSDGSEEWQLKHAKDT